MTNPDNKPQTIAPTTGQRRLQILQETQDALSAKRTHDYPPETPRENTIAFLADKTLFFYEMTEAAKKNLCNDPNNERLAIIANDYMDILRKYAMKLYGRVGNKAVVFVDHQLPGRDKAIIVNPKSFTTPVQVFDFEIAEQ